MSETRAEPFKTGHNEKRGKFSLRLGVAVLMGGAIVNGQMLLKGGPGNFRVEGEIHTSAGIPVPGAEVEWLRQGRAVSTMRANSKGHYSANLPFGSYTMTVRSHEHNGVLDYTRPDFSVYRSGRIVFDIVLRIAQQTCDAGMIGRVPESSHEPRPELGPEDAKNACGGNDRFPAPSEASEPFEVSIDYPTRRPSGSGYVYGGDRANSLGQVSIAYNLFSLEADKVIYDVKNRTIAATGNVVVADGSGTKRHADSLGFRIEDGQVIPLN